MKRTVYVAAVVAGLAGAAYAGTAAEQLGLDQAAVALAADPDPAAAQADAGLFPAYEGLSAKIKIIENLFDQGAPLPQETFCKTARREGTFTAVYTDVNGKKSRIASDISFYCRKKAGAFNYDIFVGAEGNYYAAPNGDNFESSPGKQYYRRQRQCGLRERRTAPEREPDRGAFQPDPG